MVKDTILNTPFPKPYETTNIPFWDDEHISKYMLEAHLNKDWDAASRKHTFIDKSVDFILSLIPNQDLSNITLLDLGCGPGLYDIRFARKNIAVTGIDYSIRSINYAKEEAQKENLNINYIYQDYLTIDYHQMFDIVILIYCDLGVIEDTNRELLLKKIYQALKPNGIFIFDVWTRANIKTFKKYETQQELKTGFFEKEPHTLIERNKYYPKTHNILDQSFVIKEKEIKTFNIWNKYYSKEDVRKELEKAGFKRENIEFYNDVAGTKISSSKNISKDNKLSEDNKLSFDNLSFDNSTYGIVVRKSIDNI